MWVQVPGAYAVVYVVDGIDADRMSRARDLLHELLGPSVITFTHTSQQVTYPFITSRIRHTSRICSGFTSAAVCDGCGCAEQDGRRRQPAAPGRRAHVRA